MDLNIGKYRLIFLLFSLFIFYGLLLPLLSIIQFNLFIFVVVNIILITNSCQPITKWPVIMSGCATLPSRKESNSETMDTTTSITEHPTESSDSRWSTGQWVNNSIGNSKNSDLGEKVLTEETSEDFSEMLSDFSSILWAIFPGHTRDTL